MCFASRHSFELRLIRCIGNFNIPKTTHMLRTINATVWEEFFFVSALVQKETNNINGEQPKQSDCGILQVRNVSSLFYSFASFFFLSLTCSFSLSLVLSLSNSLSQTSLSQTLSLNSQTLSLSEFSLAMNYLHAPYHDVVEDVNEGGRHARRRLHGRY